MEIVRKSPELTEAEIAEIRASIKKNIELARAEARRQGVKLHPKIAARRKAQ